MKKITKVYTRRGDEGQTSLVGGQRVSKASVRLESYGTVDELSSHLGLLASMLPEGHDKEMVESVQNNLFNVYTNLATDQDEAALIPLSLSAERGDRAVGAGGGRYHGTASGEARFHIARWCFRGRLRHMSAGRSAGVRSDGL